MPESAVAAHVLSDAPAWYQISTYLPSMATLRPFFNVSNSYVLHKLRVILFPWRHRPWSRAHRAAGSGGVAVGGVPPSGGAEAAGGTMEWQTQRRVMMEGYAAPREDVNAPDLYIPGELMTGQTRRARVTSDWLLNLSVSPWRLLPRTSTSHVLCHLRPPHIRHPRPLQ
jgi:hypothetical protein